MKKAKTTKYALLKSTLALLICFSMLIGTTFAWFTDGVTGTGNKIQSGTLNVDLELLDQETGTWHSLKETQAPIFDYDLWEPGYVETKIFKIENEGDLALKWVAQFVSENELSILADVIDVYVCPSENELQYPESRDLEGYTCVGNLRQFINTIEETTCGTLEAGEAAYLGIALKMQETAGNAYQDLSLGGAFDIRIFATQYTSESDSFGNTYDDLADESILASQSKTLESGADSIEFVIYNNGVVIAKLSVPASAIADTSKPVAVTFDGIDPSLTITVGENTKAYAYDIDVTNLKENLSGDQLVTVVITAPNALAAMSAYHNGELIEDAVYDEVEGTITFQTASFSPFTFSYNEVKVNSLAELRAAVENPAYAGKEGVVIKLTADITVNLDLDVAGNDRVAKHSFTNSTGKTYYNGINIFSQNIAIDLNGHSITANCGQKWQTLDVTGALFFVDKYGSLNILDSVGTGFIKMESSMYMVWAPFDDPSYVDIYSGAFIADSYAGDAIATPGSNTYSENDNRALVYAGTGGNMNIYGGYFLYNNTPNDGSNRNNGAFNVKDLTQKVCITIHPGVMLCNDQYRQDPEGTTLGDRYGKDENGDWIYFFDNKSIKLEPGYALKEINKSVTIDGKTYNTWYGLEEGLEVWNIGYICVGEEEVLSEKTTYFSHAKLNDTYTGVHGEVASGFYNPNPDSLTTDKIVNPATGYGSLKVTNVTNDTQLGILAGYISFEQYKSITLGYYVDGDRTTFVAGGSYAQTGLDSSFGTNCHTYNVKIDTLAPYGFAAGSTHTITYAVQTEDGILDLCVWTITMAGTGAQPNPNENAQFTDTNKPNINVIILAGQSNATGFSPITQSITNTYGEYDFSNVKIRFKNLGDNQPDGNFNGSDDYLYKNDSFVTYQLGIGGVTPTYYFGPELGLAYYLSENSGEQWAIIKYAPSASGLGNNWFGAYSLADDMISYVKESIELLDDTYDVNIRGFLWMQGETDTMSTDTVNAYAKNEQKLVQLVRSNFAQYATRAAAAPDEPGSGIAFIDAGIINIYEGTINKGKAHNCKLWYLRSDADAQFLFENDYATAGDYPNNDGAISNSVYIGTSSLTSKADATNEHQYYPTPEDKTETMHYCAASMEQLGQWFGNALGKTLN